MFYLVCFCTNRHQTERIASGVKHRELNLTQVNPMVTKFDAAYFLTAITEIEN